MSKSTKSTTENKPPAWVAPGLSASAGYAGDLFNSGLGGNPYPGSTVAPQSSTTQAGINQLANAGANGWDSSGVYDVINRSLNGGGASRLTDFANGISAQSVDGSQYDDIYARAQAPSAAETYLKDDASGKYLQEGNPFYRDRLEGELNDAAALTNSAMSGAGRFGSGAHTGVLAKNLSQTRLAGLESDYDRAMQNRYSAVGAIDAGRQAGIGAQLAATSGRMGVETGNADRALGADSLRGNMLTSAGQFEAADLDRALSGYDLDFTNKLRGAEATLSAGGMQDAYGQRAMDDEVARWYEADNADWSRLGMYQNALAGAAGNYGTQASTSRSPIGIGGILSGLGSLKGSDRRLKEDIHPVGIVNGVPVYRYRYRGEKAQNIGVMAQDLQMLRPEAVVTMPDGFFAVDYRHVGFAPVEMH